MSNTQSEIQIKTLQDVETNTVSYLKLLKKGNKLTQTEYLLLANLERALSPYFPKNVKVDSLKNVEKTTHAVSATSGNNNCLFSITTVEDAKLFGMSTKHFPNKAQLESMKKEVGNRLQQLSVENSAKQSQQPAQQPKESSSDDDNEGEQNNLDKDEESLSDEDSMSFSRPSRKARSKRQFIEAEETRLSKLQAPQTNFNEGFEITKDNYEQQGSYVWGGVDVSNQTIKEFLIENGQSTVDYKREIYQQIKSNTVKTLILMNPKYNVGVDDTFTEDALKNLKRKIGKMNYNFVDFLSSIRGMTTTMLPFKLNDKVGFEIGDTVKIRNWSKLISIYKTLLKDEDIMKSDKTFLGLMMNNPKHLLPESYDRSDIHEIKSMIKTMLDLIKNQYREAENTDSIGLTSKPGSLFQRLFGKKLVKIEEDDKMSFWISNIHRLVWIDKNNHWHKFSFTKLFKKDEDYQPKILEVAQE